MTGWTYVAACIAVPAFVGGSIFVLFEVWDRRRRRAAAKAALPVIDYRI